MRSSRCYRPDPTRSMRGSAATNGLNGLRSQLMKPHTIVVSPLWSGGDSVGAFMPFIGDAYPQLVELRFVVPRDIRLCAHARGARHHVRIAVRKEHDIACTQPDRRLDR